MKIRLHNIDLPAEPILSFQERTYLKPPSMSANCQFADMT